MRPTRCHGYNVYPIKKFYAIGWKNWKYFFDEHHLEDTLSITNESTVIHVWNKFSVNDVIQVGRNVAYGVLAQKYCPKSYSSCGTFF